jgi:hypothetical protein
MQVWCGTAALKAPGTASFMSDSCRFMTVKDIYNSQQVVQGTHAGGVLHGSLFNNRHSQLHV